jgi:hypothetical protein
MPNVDPNGLYGRNGGQWKPPSDVQGRLGGIWRLADVVWTRAAGNWVRTWERNVPAGAVTGLTVTYSANGNGWNAVATWALPADGDIASVWIQWTFDGVAQGWQQLAANATTHSRAVASGAAVTVEVYARDTGNLNGPSRSASGGTAPLHAPVPFSITPVGGDGSGQLQVTWTAPAGTRTGYNLVVTGGLSNTFAEAPGTSSRLLTGVATGVTTTATVYALDPQGRQGRPASGSAVAPAPTPPPTPATPSVSSWSYTSVTLGWSAYADPSATLSVERALGNGAFSTLATLSGSATSYTDSTVQEMTQYRYRLVATRMGLSTAGGEVRPSIGRAGLTATEPYSATKSCNWWNGVSDGPYVPANATITQMQVSVLTNFTTSVVSGTGTRSINYVGQDSIWGSVGSKPNPWNETLAYGPFGQGVAGLYVSGSGWSNSSTGAFRLLGDITVSGTQNVYYPPIANGYW